MNRPGPDGTSEDVGEGLGAADVVEGRAVAELEEG